MKASSLAFVTESNHFILSVLTVAAIAACSINQVGTTLWWTCSGNGCFPDRKKQKRDIRDE